MVVLASDSPDSNTVANHWPLSRVALATLVVATTVLAFLGMYLLGGVLLCLFIGIVLDIALRPFTDALPRIMPRFVAVAGVYALIVAILVALVVLGVPAFIVQAENLLGSLPDIYQRLRSPWLAPPESRFARFAARLPESVPAFSLADVAPFVARAGATDGTGIAIYFLRAALAVVAVILSAFYWSLQGQRTTTALLLWVQCNSCRRPLGGACRMARHLGNVAWPAARGGFADSR